MPEDTKETCAVSAEYCPHVAEAADNAVKKVFAILGVNVDVPKEVEEFRENLRFGATMRRAADKGIMAVVGTVAVAFLAVMWAGIVTSIKGH